MHSRGMGNEGAVPSPSLLAFSVSPVSLSSILYFPLFCSVARLSEGRTTVTKMDANHSSQNVRTNIITYSVVIFFSVGLVLSGGFAIKTNHKEIRQEQHDLEVRTDLRASEVNHAIDGIPKCIVCFYLPYAYDSKILYVFHRGAIYVRKCRATDS
jgi:hypothetical protein